MNPRPTRLLFEWDALKDIQNQEKHGVAFRDARRAFTDPNRIIFEDLNHSTPSETRYFCLGIVDGQVMTVRFSLRSRRIRIFGAGYWRRERRIYEERNR
jgi:uncharacterized DUF497 family protein